MVQNRVAPGTAALAGESAFKLPMTKGRPDAVNWGIAAYMAMTDAASTYSGGDLHTVAEPRGHAGEMSAAEPPPNYL